MRDGDVVSIVFVCVCVFFFSWNAFFCSLFSVFLVEILPVSSSLNGAKNNHFFGGAGGNGEPGTSNLICLTAFESTPELCGKKIEAAGDTTYNYFYMCSIFRLAKPALFRYNENFTLGRDFYAAYFVIPEIRKNIWQSKLKIRVKWKK